LVSGQVVEAASITDATVHSSLVIDEGAGSSQIFHFNNDASTGTASASSNPPDDADNPDIGFLSSEGTEAWNGVCFELAGWNFNFTPGDVQAWKVYTTAKYGITWA
jgi:hypothetical protein